MENTDFKFDLPKYKSSKIKVIGVGGAGGNAVNYMHKLGIENIDFVVCNTDAQALSNSPIPNKIQLGATITEGLGAGANPEIGERAAMETLDKIKDLLENNTKMVFITAGMGGGTGTGAAPIIAKCARDMGILTVGIVTMPFSFEGEVRQQHAEKGIERLRQHVDSLIVINNNKLRELYGNLGYKAGFAKSDEILANAAKGISEIIVQNYQVNIDLMDVRKVLADSGTALMGSATAEGENRAIEAITKAMDSPLLNDNKITGAKNVLLLIISGKNEITFDEIGLINEYIQKEAGNKANIIMGIGEDAKLEDSISVLIVATGFSQDHNPKVGTEKIIKHSLEDESPANDDFQVKTKSDTPSSDNPIHRKSNDEKKVVRLELTEEDFTHEVSPDDEIELRLIKRENPVVEEPQRYYTLDFGMDLNSPSESSNSSTKKESKKKDSNQPTIFRLDELNDEVDEVSFDVTPKDEIDPVQRIIEERRRRLREFNALYKKTTTLPETSAYRRFHLKEDMNEDEKGKGSIYLDSKNNHLRPNSFLHDNVD